MSAMGWEVGSGKKQTAFDNAVPLQVQLTLKALLGNLLCHAFIPVG